MLSLANMRALVAVVEEGSFTRAAERLNATQSGISQQVAKMERSLDVVLLERKPAGIAPTPAGLALYARSVAVLEGVVRAEAEAKRYSGSFTGAIRMGLMPALTRSLMGPVLRRFMEQHPNLTVTAVEAVSTELVERTKAAELDIAIVPVFDAPPSLRCRAVGSSPEVLVSRGPRHRLHMKPVALGSLRSLKLILQPAGNMRRERILGHLRAQGIEIAHLIDLDSMLGTLEFVDASDYATILPAVMVAPEIENASLCVRPITDAGFVLEMMAVEPGRRPPSDAFQALTEAFAAALARARRDLPGAATRTLRGAKGQRA